jgi:hypothetical protein
MTNIWKTYDQHYRLPVVTLLACIFLFALDEGGKAAVTFSRPGNYLILLFYYLTTLAVVYSLYALFKRVKFSYPKFWSLFFGIIIGFSLVIILLSR